MTTSRVLAFILFTGFISFTTNLVMAQKKYLVENYWVENYGKQQGLPEDIIIDIMQDKKGYMWMTTPYSLVRFDGYEFKAFSPRDQFPELYTHFSTGLMEDSRGIFWMATIDVGLFSFDPQTQKFTRYYAGKNALSICGNKVKTIAEDDHGNIWVGTTAGLNCLFFTGSTIQVRKYAIQISGDLLQHFNAIIDKNNALVSLIRVGNLESRQEFIDVNQTSRYFVVSMGEAGNNSMADYGWIENNLGKVIWKHELSKSLPAGGDLKNMLHAEIIQLTPGKYKVAYKTDDSHAWNNWNAVPPDRPELWGIQLFKLSASLSDTMAGLLATASGERTLANDNIKCLLKDAGNMMWALTDSGLEKLQLPSSYEGKLSSEKSALLSSFISGKSVIKTGPGQLVIVGLNFDSAKKKYESTLLSYNYLTKTSGLIPVGNPAGIDFRPHGSHSFLRDPSGLFWFGTFDDDGHGVYVAEEGKESSTFRRLDLTPPEPDEPGQPTFDQIWSIYQDRSGYIWIGSRVFGLFKIKSRKSPVRFVSLARDTTKDLKFSGIAQDGNENIWVNEIGRDIFNYSIQNKQISSPGGMLMDSGNYIFYNRKENALVVTGKNHFGEYVSGQSAFKSIPLAIPDSLKVFAADPFGNYWASCSRCYDVHKYYYVYDGIRFQTVPFDSSGDFERFFRHISFGRNGNIWVCPAFEGLHQYRLDNQSKKTTFVKKFLPKGYDVYDVYEDDQGLLWLGTYDNGLLRLDPSTGRLKAFTKKDGLPSNFVISIIHCGKNLWVLTDLGSAFVNIEKGTISKYKELDEYIAQTKKGPISFSFRDPGYYPNVVVTPSGEIAFLAKDGICLFNPGDFVADSTKPVLHIAALQVGKQMIAFPESQDMVLKFSHEQKDLMITYVGLHYDRPSLNQYAYFLKGANEGWVNAGTEKIARYSNLSPGYYEFFLKCANADGIWSDEQRMFVFTIRPPWWQTWWAYILYVFVLVAGVWSYVKYRSGHLEKENILLETKVADRTTQLNRSMDNLKATQSQLIQSEKMASLGELTAGIAHEIQNPLNFVNNFSEVNIELIDEASQSVKTGNPDGAIELLSTLKDNEEKINHHGKRADAIVKGMLQHSRSGTGQKELVNINAVADECLRLSYHGLRAKEKSFQADLQTKYDEGIGNMLLIQQDMVRILINLLNNAFYAVSEKSKQQIRGYEPVVSLTTKKIGDKVEVKIKDNGTGIPQKVLEKIFQPFFTTKPTGQGTGLGLSLSYDIVKANGGEITVNTKEGEFTEFTVQLPAS